MSVTPISFPSISGVGSIGGLDATSGPDAISGTTAPTQAAPSSPSNGQEFGNLVLDGLDRVEGLTDKADNLSVQAATGNLSNIHDYTIAASEAQTATQLTVAVRNQALDAFNKILQMQV